MINNISVLDFMKKFPTEEVCEKYIVDARWPRGINCPICGNHKIYRYEATKRFKCSKCQKQFTVRTGSVLASSKVTLQQWLMAIWLLTSHPKGLSSVQMSKTLGVTQKTAWFLSHRIRESFKEGNGGLFSGHVEIDETYIGGKEANKHQNKKLNAGRGPVGKIAVVGVKNRNGKCVAMPVKDTTSLTLHRIINKHVEKGANVYTDDHRAYKGLLGYNHQTVNHSVGEYVRGMASTNGIESFWALLKRGFYGVYHQMSPAHLAKYVTEFNFRHNASELSCEKVLQNVFYNSNGKRLTYAQLINE